METKIIHNHVYMILNGIRFVGFIVFLQQKHQFFDYVKSNIFKTIKNNGFNLYKIETALLDIHTKQMRIICADKKEFSVPEKFKEILLDNVQNIKYLVG